MRPTYLTAKELQPHTAALTANRADELTRHIRNGAVTITGTADPAATVNYFHTGSAAPRPAEQDASGRWVAPNVPMHPMSNGLVRIQFRVDQDGQAPSFRLSEFSVNKVTTAIGNDGKQKSAKPKVQTQGDRDFEAVRTHGVRSGIPRRNGNCYGSITNLPSGDTLAYDCEGNLSCVSNAVSGAVSLYWYDQHGRRIAKQENGLLTLYIWDGMDIIATASADGTIREYYTRGIGIAGDVGSLVAETRFSGGTATTTYLHSNWRGDVVMATDTSGNVVGEYSYTTFGEQLSATGTYTPRFTFSSKERDASGLVYHGFRYYSPVLCRWISEDPIRERGGLNLYQFCVNNPVNNIDTDGLRVEIHSRWVKGLEGIAAHTYITVTDSTKEVNTWGSYSENGYNKAKHNDPSDVGTLRTSTITVPPPKGMTQDEWDKAVNLEGLKRVQNQNQKYRLRGGDGGKKSGNCHTTTRGIIEAAGGSIPKGYDPPGRNPGLR